jgi:peptidyl-prolyl cis-trans isomerase SurA
MKLVALVLLLGGTARAEILDRVVAVVENEPITQSELQARVQLMTSMSPGFASEHALDILVEERLIELGAGELRVAVTDSEIDRAIDAVAKNAQLTRDALLEQLRMRRINVDDYRAELRRQLLSAKLMNVAKREEVARGGTFDKARRAWLDEARRRYTVEIRR